MSRSTVIILLVILALIGGGIGWYYLRGKPGELDIAANKNLPQLPEAKFGPTDWPWWRGPTRNGNSPDSKAPTKWSESENIAWKTPIPGRGHSSPIVLGNRVFLTTADEGSQKQIALAIDRGNGKILWEKTVHEGNLGKKHGDNSYASGTPCTDGERVFVCFQNNGAIYVSALNIEDGNIIWSKNAGPHGGSGTHGTGSSLALWGSFVYICDDSPGAGIERAKGWVAALHRSTGEFGWRKERKSGMGSYGSPTITEFDGKPHLLVAGSGSITAYDPTDGKETWSRDGLGDVSANTPAFSPNMVFASTGVGRVLLAVRSDGSQVWKKQGSPAPYPPSMLWYKDYLYVLQDDGHMGCYVAENGDEKWNERVRGTYYASPILVGNNIYICNRDGVTTILEATPDGYLEVGRNKLDGGINATPAIVGGKIYLRTETHLYCIGN